MDLAEVKQIFHEGKVTKALLIDDAFDPPPEFDGDDLQEAFQLIERDDAIETAFTAIGGRWPADQAAFSEQLRTDPTVQEQLRLALNEDTPLAPLANALYGANFVDYLSKRRPLDALRALLGEIGVQTKEIGRDDRTKLSKYPLIFLDYYLGDNSAPSVERSIEKIKDILGQYNNHEMPIIVLMSSELTDDGLADVFRAKAKLLGSQFKFVTKSEFTEAVFEFISSLADRVQSLHQGQVVGDFVRTWRDALDGALQEFTLEIRSLDIPDFYFIWKKAGEGKNGRFGEHMSVLFDGYLRKQIEDNAKLNISAEKLNKITFDTEPSHALIPSRAVAKLAHAAAFRTLDPFPDDYNGPPLGIDLGDLFISEHIKRVGKARHRVMNASMVISQACDLEHGKVGTVLMIDGDVHKPSARMRTNNTSNPERVLRIDIFQFEADNGDIEDLVIEWDAQRLRAVPVDGFHRQMREGKFQRVARLRSVHALAMQQKFASNLTRVGMPDKLPSYRYTCLEVVTRRKDGSVGRLFGPTKRDENLACVIGDDERTMVILDKVFVQIRAALKASDPEAYEPEVLEKLRKEFDDVGKVRRLGRAKLDRNKKEFGPVLLLDSEAPLSKFEDNWRKVVLVINLFPGL